MWGRFLSCCGFPIRLLRSYFCRIPKTWCCVRTINMRPEIAGVAITGSFMEFVFNSSKRSPALTTKMSRTRALRALTLLGAIATLGCILCAKVSE